MMPDYEPDGILGDPFARIAQFRLELEQDYPGDKDSDADGVTDLHRFQVYRIEDGKHAILDALRRDREVILVDSDLLRDPTFCITRWYAGILGRDAGLTNFEIGRWMHSPARFSGCMGDAREEAVSM
ncbi:hypothetical protein BD779DRAFT_1732349, partial [Infundibulicybe gibba]